MTRCSRCHQPFNFYSGIPDICLICKYQDELLNHGPFPDKLLDDVTKASEVLEAERIIKEGSKNEPPRKS